MRRTFLNARRSQVAAAVIAAIGSTAAQAANVSWVGPNASFWDLAANWSSNPALPGAADDALLGAFNTTFRSSGAFTALTIRSFNGTGLFSVTGGTLTFTNASSVGSFAMTGGQLAGTGDLTITGAATLTTASFSGAGTTAVQGATTISSLLNLDGGRLFRNDGTVTQTGNVNLNARSSGAEAGNGSVLNALGGTWNAGAAGGTVFFVTNQGAGDTGAGATFTNAGTFNKQAAGLTDVRTNFVNNGSLNVQAGQLQFSTGGALTHNGTLSIASGAILDFASTNAVTHAINTASTTIAGTLSITGSNLLNFTQAHAIGGTGTFQQGAGQVIGANLTLGPTLNVNITGGGHSGAATTTVQGITSITGTGLSLDGGRIFRNEGTVTQTNGTVNLNSRSSGIAEAGNGTVTNALGGTWNSNATASNSNFILASNQGAGDTGAGAVFTNQGSFNKQGAFITEVRTAFNNTGAINVQAGQLQFGTGGALTHNGTISIASGAILDFASNNTVTQTINTANTTIAGTLSITGDNLVNFTQAHTIGGTGTFLQNAGQVTGANLTLGPTLAFNITDGGHSGAATTTVQGTGSISGTGMRLDGGRIFRNEGTLTQTNANVDMNSRRPGTAAEAGNGTVTNAVGGTWNSNATASNSNFISASNQGAGDTGAGAVFTNQGTFIKQGAFITEVRTAFNNTGSINVQAGQLQFANGGALTHNGTIDIASGAILDFASGNTVTQTINTASTTIAGTLSITNNNFVNFTQAHTIGGTGTFLQNFGQVTGSNLTLGPSLTVNITDGGHSGAATTTVQGTTTISGTGLRLDGARIFRNEGTLTQTNANVDMNSRLSGAAEAGNGTVTNAVGGTWNSNATASNSNFILASNQGAGDTGVGAVFTNQGTFNKQGAFVTEVRTAFNNTGLTDVQVGQLRFTTNGTQGNGTLQTSGGILEIQGASTTGNLFHNTNTANSLVLGGNTITVSADYNNANFGVGNAFNRRANVSTTGTGNRLLAAGDVNQGLSGTGISNGLTTAPSIVVGNVHVGATTYTYNINNIGTTGPALRGAIQDTANGGNITDARLSGNGVLSSNWGPLAPGASTSRDVTITVGAAGVYAPISGQAVSIVNNFENTRSQLLTISSAAGAAAYNLAAAAAVTPNPVNLANQRVGGTGSAALTIANTAPTGIFSEGLNASFAGTSGSALTNGGAINLLAAGASNNSAMTVRLDGSTAGAKTGGVQVNFASDGSGTSGLGITGLAGQVINVSGNFYNMAVGSTTPSPITIANQRVGGSGSQLLTVGNTAAAGAFSEALNASFEAATAGITNNGGSVSNLIAGGSNAAAMRVGVDATSAGAKSGSVTLAYQSDGTGANGNSGLAAISAGTQIINVSGNVYNTAAGAATPTPVVIANQRVGGSGSQLLTVSNTAASGSFSEDLRASFGANSGNASNNGGIIAALLAGSNNASAMSMGVNTTLAGAQSGSVTLNYQTTGTVNGVTNGLGLAAANAPQTINVSGNVYQLAQPTGLPASVNLGNFRAGTAQSQTVTLSNTNIAPTGFQEGLNASIVGITGVATGSGVLNNVAAGASGNLQVGVTGLAGANTGSIQVQLASNGTGTSGLGNLDLGGAQTVTVSGTGWRLAAANTQPATINFGNVLVGSTQAQFLNIQNSAVADGFSERLDARFFAGGTTGAATNNGGSIGLLVAGASNNTAMSVGVSTATIGAKAGQVILAFDSNGLATSGLGISGLPNQNIGILADVIANVGTLAQPSSVTPNPVNFGNFRVNAAGAGPQNLSISNLATIGEGLNASIATASAGFTATGAFTSLAPTATNGTSLQVSFNGTGTAGAKSGTATVTLVSDGTFNAGTTTPLPAQTVTMNAGVYNAAVGSATPSPITIASQRVGGSAGQLLTVANTAAAGAFSEALNVSFSASTTGITNNGGSVANLIAGGSNAAAMSVGVDASSAGTKSGTVTLAYQTDGTGPNGNSGLAPIAAGSQVIGVQGNVYAPAVLQLNTASVNFGIVHVGDAVPNRNVSVSNTAAVAGLNDVLRGSISGGAPPFSSGGTLGAGVAAGGTNAASLQVGLNTGSAGDFTGNATVTFASHNAEMSDLPLGTANVALQATVNNRAQLALTQTAGSGSLAQVGNTYTVNFGSLQQGATDLDATLAVLNSAAGPADLLNGSFSIGPGTGFALSGFNSFAAIAAGASFGGLGISFDSASLGEFTQTILISATGSNASGFIGALADTTLVLSGSVVAVSELDTYTLMAGGLISLWLLRRRKPPSARG